MSAWENVPYELQSPAWRNAMNGGNARSEPGEYDPSLNISFIDRFASAFRSSSDRQGGEDVTANIDGRARGVEWLRGAANAVISSIGGETSDTPDPSATLHPAAYGGAARDMRSNMSVPVILGGAALVGLAVYAASR